MAKLLRLQRAPALRDLHAAFGIIPNIAGVMATSPVLINSLVGLFGRPSGYWLGGGGRSAVVQPPPSATTRLTVAVSREARVDRADS